MDNNQEIISRLKFIGKLKKGEKINTRHMYVQPDGFGTSLSRTFMYQDNRGNALNFCQDTITRSFELLITYERSLSNSEQVLFYHLIKDLEQSAIGLSNLKFTYVSDTKFCCDMDTLLQHIEANLERFNREEYFKNTYEEKEDSKYITTDNKNKEDSNYINTDNKNKEKEDSKYINTDNKNKNKNKKKEDSKYKVNIDEKE